MGRFTHNICKACWNIPHPGREPTRLAVEVPEEKCCFCKNKNHDGIFVRFVREPETLLCKNDHRAFNSAA